MNNFGLIFDIIRTVKALPLVLNKQNGSSISEIMKVIYDVSKETDVEALWARLQKDKKLKSKLIDKMMKLSIEKEKLAYIDISNARNRDIKIRKASGGRNFRADMMIITAWGAIIFLVISLLYFRHSLTGDIVLIFSSIISFLGSIIADAHFFEFGGGRKGRKKKR